MTDVGMKVKRPDSYLCPSCGECWAKFFEAPTKEWQCGECDKRDAERRQAWVAFCAAAMCDPVRTGQFSPQHTADAYLSEYDARFPKRRV